MRTYVQASLPGQIKESKSGSFPVGAFARSHVHLGGERNPPLQIVERDETEIDDRWSLLLVQKKDGEELAIPKR